MGKYTSSPLLVSGIQLLIGTNYFFDRENNFNMTITEINEEVTIKLFNPFLEFEDVKNIWLEMLNKCPHSFFLSWGWIETWLKNLPKECNLSLIVGFKNKIPVFSFFIGFQKKYRYNIIKAHLISMNETGISSVDALTLEYNAILIDPEVSLSLKTLIRLLPINDWDEFCFSYMDSRLLADSKFHIDSNDTYAIQTDKIASPYVDLKKVRDADMNYLSLLSQKRRKKLRRSIKKYEQKGTLQFKVADTADEALSMLEELKKLHQKTWIERGKPGTFSSDFICNFHKDLIASCFHKNEIQLIHVTCGQDTVGYNYNFIYNGHVYSYLGGFNYQSDSHLLPGMMCDYFSILHCAEKGLNAYDFLAGDVEYKRSLSTDSSEMQDILVQKKTIPLAIERKLRQMYFPTRKMMNQIFNVV
jgi:hypothetical protein